MRTFTVTLLSLLLSGVVNTATADITFVVDENLPEPVNNDINMISQARRVQEFGSSEYLAASFWDIDMTPVDAPFFTGMVKAFADHRPVSFSPDLIWLLVSQAFSHNVNGNPERFRDRIVDFDGKVDLVVRNDVELYDPRFDWVATVDSFAAKIEANTSNDVAKLITADFSTTGPVERLASEIVLMETTRAYFEFVVMRLGCGIPSVTLTGTVQDWQRVLDKALKLRDLGAEDWIDGIIPILEQFVKAAGGNPDREFWKDIVIQNKTRTLKGGGCSFESPTELDGWFLKLMPYDKFGKRAPEKVPHTYDDHAAQMASVPVRYVVFNPILQEADHIIDLQLSGGIAGFRADSITNCVSFEIGWSVRKSSSDIIDSKLRQDLWGQTRLRVTQVPEELRIVNHFQNLELIFTDVVNIPLWVDSLDIKKLTVTGSMTYSQMNQLKLRFGDRISFKVTEAGKISGTGILFDAAVANGLKFSLRDYEADVTGYVSIPADGKVIIPDSVLINGWQYPVRGIGACCFQNCLELKSIRIPRSVNRIGGRAFAGCRNLKDVRIGNYDNLWIGYEAFSRCYSLPVRDHVVYAGKIAVTTDDSPQHIGDPLPGRPEYRIRKGTRIIGEFAFQCCEKMEKLKIPNSVEIICNGAFKGCTSLKEARIPEGVKVIGSAAFSCCYGLERVYLPGSLKSVGLYTGDSKEYFNLSYSNLFNNDTKDNYGNIFELCDQLVEITEK